MPASLTEALEEISKYEPPHVNVDISRFNNLPPNTLVLTWRELTVPQQYGVDKEARKVANLFSWPHTLCQEIGIFRMAHVAPPAEDDDQIRRFYGAIAADNRPLWEHLRHCYIEAFNAQALLLPQEENPALDSAVAAMKNRTPEEAAATRERVLSGVPSASGEAPGQQLQNPETGEFYFLEGYSHPDGPDIPRPTEPEAATAPPEGSA